MHPRPKLPERDTLFLFEHQESEVNYGGEARFHQAAFPAAEGETATLEILLFRAAENFFRLLAGGNGEACGAGLLEDAELRDIYFDQHRETPRLSVNAFRLWYREDLGAVAETYLRLRRNAVDQEASVEVPRLNYLAALAAATRSAEILSEYCERAFGQQDRVLAGARLTFARSLAKALAAAEDDAGLRGLIHVRLRQDRAEPAVLRLFNPLSLCAVDSADVTWWTDHWRRFATCVLSEPVRVGLQQLLAGLLAKPRAFAPGDARRVLAEPEAVAQWWANPRERRRLLRRLRAERDLRQKLTADNVRLRLRLALRTLAASGRPEDWELGLAGERRLEELLHARSARRRFLRRLRRLTGAEAVRAAAELEAGVRRLRRAKRRWFARLSRAELAEEAGCAMSRLARENARIEDFRQLRRCYGRDSSQAASWQRLKLWPLVEYRRGPEGAPGETAGLWEQRREEIENAYAEGNLFLIRSRGEIYPRTHRRLERTTFLFADLRNSTETTMKLTKDTASYLTPYLTAVDSEAQQAGGQRIYFAGDGYAAYYTLAADAVRGAWALANRFNKLRALSREEHRRRAKELYQRAWELKIEFRKPVAIRRAFARLDVRTLAPDLKDFLLRLAALKDLIVDQPTMTRILATVAANYAMPRVDVGVAITGGELFFAMVGEEERPKIPIVISPALTQAARLSGSSEAVKQHLDEAQGGQFPFNVHVWDKKLYNRGILLTQDALEEQLRREVQIEPLASQDPRFRLERLESYVDRKLGRRIILRHIQDTVLLKGISLPCQVLEVCLPGSPLDRLHGNI